LPHLASIFRFAPTDPCRTIVSTVSDSTAVLSPSLLTSTTAIVPGYPSRASIRSPAREEHIYGISEIGHTVRLKLDLFIVRREARRSRYSAIVAISLTRNRSTTESKAQQYL
jgi:hypothetical protein